MVIGETVEERLMGYMDDYDEELEEEDFYEESEEKSSEIKGVTGTVTSYTFTNMSYPCIIFKEGVPIPKHKLKIVANMTKAGGNLEKDTSLYYMNEGSPYKIGSISGTQIMGFLDLVGLECIVGFVDAETELNGGAIYSLCTSFD